MAKLAAPRASRKKRGKKTKKKDPRTGPRIVRGPNGFKLKQKQYFHFTSDIRIYHYSASYLSLHKFKTLLDRPTHGYVATLIGTDELLSRNIVTDPNDTMPPGALEVGYLPSVFIHGGSALGFRVGKGVVEWLCFDRDIKESILDRRDINTEAQRMLFEHVANLEKPEPTSKSSRRLPYTEHRDWFVSLKEAGRRPCSIRLTWRNFGTELREENLTKRRLEEEVEKEEGNDDEEGWEDEDGYGDEMGVSEEIDGREADSSETDSSETINSSGSFGYYRPVMPAIESSRYRSGPVPPERNFSPPPPPMQSYRKSAKEQRSNTLSSRRQR